MHDIKMKIKIGLLLLIISFVKFGTCSAQTSDISDLIRRANAGNVEAQYNVAVAMKKVKE